MARLIDPRLGRRQEVLGHGAASGVSLSALIRTGSLRPRSRWSARPPFIGMEAATAVGVGRAIGSVIGDGILQANRVASITHGVAGVTAMG